MSTRMPSRPAHAKNSVTHSKGGKCPISGSAKSGFTSCPKAASSVKNRMPKLTIVNQCATATTGRRDIRV